jgi:hypothetical protein
MFGCDMDERNGDFGFDNDKLPKLVHAHNSVMVYL